MTRGASHDFRQAARAQRVCQSPGCEKPTSAWHAHHVVTEQELRRLGLDLWDPRNAMRLCSRCHFRHHSRFKALSSRALSDGHIAFAREVLGEDAARGYIERTYDTTEDARF